MHRVFEDPYKYKGMRKRLAASIAAKDKFDPAIIQAIESLPRHYFLESVFAEMAYEDKAFSIGKGQTISQPFTVVYQTQLLDVKSGQRVLEIGTGSGYQAAVLASIGAIVYSIERIPELTEKAKKVLKELNLLGNIKLYIGDGTMGLEKHAPYDRILVTAAAPDIPQPLIDQLTIGGYLVIPVGDKDSQNMVRIKKTQTGTETETFENFRFVPLIGEKGWKEKKPIHK